MQVSEKVLTSGIHCLFIQKAPRKKLISYSGTENRIVMCYELYISQENKWNLKQQGKQCDAIFLNEMAEKEM